MPIERAPVLGPPQHSGARRDARTHSPAGGKEPTRSFLSTLLLTIAMNTGVAVFLRVLGVTEFGTALLHAQAIGLSIVLLLWGGNLLWPGRTWIISPIAVLLGAVSGILVYSAIEHGPRVGELLDRPSIAAGSMVGAVLFGTLMALIFHSRSEARMGRARLREELLRRAEDARHLAEAELKLLQAQIEPHFLFNTLSNILQLIHTDPPGAHRMLMNLTNYLRGSLRRTRAGATTVVEELDLVRAYLDIQAMRMGGRLSYRIACAPDLRYTPLPPLLVQPLVENAIRHGLEPLPAGGEVAVSVSREGDALVLEVIDNGLGIDPHRPPGVGLSNVRDRVEAISQGRGSVVLRANAPTGVCVRISLPLGSGPRQAERPAEAQV